MEQMNGCACATTIEHRSLFRATASIVPTAAVQALGEGHVLGGEKPQNRLKSNDLHP